MVINFEVKYRDTVQDEWKYRRCREIFHAEEFYKKYIESGFEDVILFFKRNDSTKILAKHSISRQVKFEKDINTLIEI